MSSPSGNGSPVHTVLCGIVGDSITTEVSGTLEIQSLLGFCVDCMLTLGLRMWMGHTVMIFPVSLAPPASTARESVSWRSEAKPCEVGLLLPLVNSLERGLAVGQPPSHRELVPALLSSSSSSLCLLFSLPSYGPAHGEVSVCVQPCAEITCGWSWEYSAQGAWVRA